MKNTCFSVLCLLLCLVVNAQQTALLDTFRTMIANQALVEANHHHQYFSGTSVLEVQTVSDRVVNVYLDITNEVLHELDEHAKEEYLLVMHHMMENLDYQIKNIYVKTAFADYALIDNFIEEEDGEVVEYDEPKNSDPFANIEGHVNQYAYEKNNPTIGQAQPTGALSGKTVWLSPGHGWIYYTTLGS